MMKKHQILLMVDGSVDIILGILLMLFPIGVIDLLGLPPSSTNFYPSILGAVIFGIGIALFLELAGFTKQVRGLGLGGALVINLMGSFVLICRLIFGSLPIPLKGLVILWIVGIVVFVIGLAELVTRSWSYER